MRQMTCRRPESTLAHVSQDGLAASTSGKGLHPGLFRFWWSNLLALRVKPLRRITGGLHSACLVDNDQSSGPCCCKFSIGSFLNQFSELCPTRQKRNQRNICEAEYCYVVAGPNVFF